MFPNLAIIKLIIPMSVTFILWFDALRLLTTGRTRRTTLSEEAEGRLSQRVTSKMKHHGHAHGWIRFDPKGRPKVAITKLTGTTGMPVGIQNTGICI